MDIPLLDHVAPYIPVGDMVTLEGSGCLGDYLVDIDNTVATADSIAPDLANAPKEEW